MDVTKEIKQLRAIMPNAVISVEFSETHIKYECDMRHAKISEKEHEDYFLPIKKLFGDRLMERYSHETGYFDIFVKPATNPTLN